MVDPFCAGSFSSFTDRCSNRASKVLVAIWILVSVGDCDISLLICCLFTLVYLRVTCAAGRKNNWEVYYFQDGSLVLAGQQAMAQIARSSTGGNHLGNNSKSSKKYLLYHASTVSLGMSLERLSKRAVRARCNEEAEYGSSLSENEDQDIAEGRISDSEESSNDTATTVSKEDVSGSCCRSYLHGAHFNTAR